MQLVAGVLTDRTDLTSGTTYPGTPPVSSSGARGNTTNYVLDGGSNNDHYTNGPNPMPNPDALQEFSVQTNSFSAEYGRNVGAIVNAVTRAGTNQYHGLGFGYFRHYKFNANNFFTPGVDDGLKRSQYGGTFGGPILRNRTFFFASYQGTNQRRKPTNRSGLVPSAAMRAGDFSAIPRALRNPFTGEPFPNNQIPTSLFSPAAVKIANEWLPLPNPVGADNPLTLRFAQPSDDDDHQWLGRADHTFTDKHRMYGRFWVSRASHARRAPRRQHPQQRLRPDVAEHGRVDQRHLHPASEPAEQPGRDVQPDEQPQLPDLSARLLDPRHQRLQRRDAAVGLQRLRLLRHQQRRHEYVPPQRNPVRGHGALDEGAARGRDRHRLQLRPGRHRQQLPRQRPVHVQQRGGVLRRRDVGFLPRQVLELRTGDRRIQEHAHALPGDVRPGHVPGEPASSR